MQRHINDEGAKDLKSLGYKTRAYAKYGTKLFSFKENDSSFFILECPLVQMLAESCENYTCKILANKIKKLINQFDVEIKNILIVGLGNPKIECDTFGIKVCEKITKNENVFLFCPDVTYHTNLLGAELVREICELKKIDLVIVIDSLLTDRVDRLGVSFQINNEGLTPGSGLGQNNMGINKINVNAHCIAIGVPMMIDVKNIGVGAKHSKILTIKDIYAEVDKCAKIVSMAIEQVWFK